MRCADNDGNGDCDRGAVGYRLWNPHRGLSFETVSIYWRT